MPIPKLDERDQLAILQTITGCSVTQRIKTVKQPRGGFLNPNLFEETVLDSPDDLAPVENIHASLVGLAVDYLTRFMTGSPVDEAFEISFKGAKLAKRTDTAHQLLSRIKGLDDDSIIAAAKLVTYDACHRNGYFDSNAVNSVNPDTDTCSNIRIMVNRALHFFDLYGPKTQDTMTFEGGYTHTVNAGDGDFMTADTLWDFKVSKKKPTKDHTLQLIMYWRMGLHSIHPEYKNVRYLGIFNPRLNTVYRYEVNRLPEETIEFVDYDIIVYPPEI